VDSEKRDRARALFGEGMSRLDQGDLPVALARFRESYALVPSPNSHLMTARTLARMGRVNDAWAEYAAVIAEAKQAAGREEKYAATQQSAESERDTLRSQIGLVTVDIHGDVPPDAVLVVGDQLLGPDDSERPIAVAPGAARVTLVAPGIGKAEQSVEVTAGGDHHVTLQAEPAAAPCASEGGNSSNSALKTMAFISGGIGVAGFGLLAVTAITDGSDGLAAAGMSVGAFGIGMGVALYSVALSTEDDSASASRATVVAGPGSVGVVGTF
jgi:hypothetical protein